MLGCVPFESCAHMRDPHRPPFAPDALASKIKSVNVLQSIQGQAWKCKNVCWSQVTS